ncbi:MAG: glycosyltransferase family 4 protein, partial [Myxococcota bacterium]
VKGTSDLIEIIEATWRRRPTARFVVAGGLVDNRKAERRWRRRFDDQLSAGARGATELVGWLSPEALSAALARTRVMVVPSRYETFGLSAAEAMLHGVPVVATDNPGTRAVLPPDAPPMGLAEIAEALATLLEDGALAAARGTAAARYARDHHLWPRHIAGYRAAYAQAAAAR